jgi:hypothetical protein
MLLQTSKSTVVAWWNVKAESGLVCKASIKEPSIEAYVICILYVNPEELCLAVPVKLHATLGTVRNLNLGVYKAGGISWSHGSDNHLTQHQCGISTM